MAQPQQRPIAHGLPFGMQDDTDAERQPMDIANEFFKEDMIKTKSDIPPNHVAIISRTLWFARRYHIPDLVIISTDVLLLNRSKNGKFAKMFGKALENMKPTFENKEGGGLIQ